MMWPLFILVVLLVYGGYRWQLWRLPHKGLLAIMYHHIRPDTTDAFTIFPAVLEKQLQMLQEQGFSFIGTTELLQAQHTGKPLPPKPVLLTFDDGYADNVQYLFPLLQKYQAKALIFLVTDAIGKNPEYMTWPQVKQLQQSGLVEFGSHTCSHTRLRHLSGQEIIHELTQSKQQIEQETGVPCTAFCYPFGSGGFDKRVRPLVFQAGYQLDFSTKPGINPWPWYGKKTLLRVFPRGGETLFDFYIQITRGKSRF